MGLSCCTVVVRGAATLAAGVWDGDEGASVNGGSMRMGGERRSAGRGRQRDPQRVYHAVVGFVARCAVTTTVMGGFDGDGWCGDGDA
ncbi:hypothetical protein SESBI_50318 [Sesbania bispinosa]|nr:hypothetical protein SESBI_50318 [Sesbania bispinosa]